MYLPRDVQQITEEHLQRLIEWRAPESSNLEFKRDLPGKDGEAHQEKARQDFAADISAFANSGGGDIIYGVEEYAGSAARITPCTGNPDKETARLLDILANTVEPRLPPVQTQVVSVSGGFVLVVRVPKSWAAPHRVIANRHFYIRENNRKRALNVPEIRSLVIGSETQRERVRKFRERRLGELVAGRAPVRLAPGPALVVHLVPSAAIIGQFAVDPIPYMTGKRYLPIVGAEEGGRAARVNIDGALAVRTTRDSGAPGYSQFFRDGSFESVKVFSPNEVNQVVLPSAGYERHLIQLLTAFRKELEQLEFPADLVCMLSLTRADEVVFGVSRSDFILSSDQGRFDRDLLMWPDVELSEADAAERALRPVFDMVWQAAGLHQSFNYDENGNWVGRH